MNGQYLKASSTFIGMNKCSASEKYSGLAPRAQSESRILRATLKSAPVPQTNQQHKSS
jgi:hypothetical protein